MRECGVACEWACTGAGEAVVSNARYWGLVGVRVRVRVRVRVKGQGQG